MKPYTLTWVGFASTPLLFNKRQNCQAVLPSLLFDSSMTTAFNNPRPLTSLTSGELNARTPERNFSPSTSARSDRRSSIKISRATVAMAHPNGFLRVVWTVRKRSGRTRRVSYPPYVLPCSPGFMQSMTSLSANTADTGYTRGRVSRFEERPNNANCYLLPPERAFPSKITSARMPSW